MWKFCELRQKRRILTKRSTFVVEGIFHLPFSEFSNFLSHKACLSNVLIKIKFESIFSHIILENFGEARNFASFAMALAKDYKKHLIEIHGSRKYEIFMIV